MSTKVEMNYIWNPNAYVDLSELDNLVVNEKNEF